MKTKIIVIFGGVYSSLGKGIVASSIGAILSKLGYKVQMLKMDPYLNVNAGVLSPYQHGETFVTKDGHEADLDFGNYERFISQPLNKYAGMTSGSVYWQVISDERHNRYNGKTIQIIPTITDAIKDRITKHIEANQPDFLIIEVGGTIGDIESLPFVEALSQYSLEYGFENFMPILVAPLIKLKNGEIKTKPIQHAWKELNSLGIHPNMIILRSDKKVSKELNDKLSSTCHIKNSRIFASLDSPSIYFVPQNLYDQKIHLEILDFFKIKFDKKNDNFAFWTQCIKKIKSCKKSISIGIVGKYVELHDAYASLMESLKFACWKNNLNLKIKWFKADDMLKKDELKSLKSVSGIVIPTGFGPRGTEGKIKAIEFARTNKIPLLGIGLGFQLSLVEFARNVLNIPNANSTEFDSKCFPIFKMNETNEMILGGKEINIKKDSLAYNIYKTEKINGRFRNKYIFELKNKEMFEKAGVIFGATLADATNNVVGMELPIETHPFFYSCLYLPEYNCGFFAPDNCFDNFIKASTKNV